MTELSHIGRAFPKDGPDKVTGRALYSEDVKLPGTLFAAFCAARIRLPPIVRIDTTKALALPGVKAVITVDDTKGIKHGFVERCATRRTRRSCARARGACRRGNRGAGRRRPRDRASCARYRSRSNTNRYRPVFDPFEAINVDAPKTHPTNPKVAAQAPYSNIGGRTTTGVG